MRVLFDANTIAAGAVQPRGGGTPPGLIFDAWLVDRFELLISDHLLDAVARTFAKLYFLARLDSSVRSATMMQLETDAIRVVVTVDVTGVASHAEDDLVLAAAVSGSAEYLVTGDRQLQQLGAFQGVRILSPRAFLTVLESGL